MGFSDFGLGRALYIAEALSLLGLKITIITNKSIYPSASTKEKSEKLNANVEVVEFNIPFARILYGYVLGRLLVYLVYAAISFACIMRIFPKPDLFYSRGPHPFTDVLGILYKKIEPNVTIISDITDLWPDTLEYVNMNGLLKRVLVLVGHCINHVFYSRVEAVVTLNEVMAKVLKDRIGRDAHVLYGSIDLNRFRPMDKRCALRALPNNLFSKVDGKFVVLYAGVMGTFQNPLVIVDMAESLQEESKQVIFVAIGSGPLKQELEKKVREKLLVNVIVLDAVPHELMPFVYNIADLVLLPPPVMSNPAISSYFLLSLPKKFIEYAACGKPILCMTPPCVASKLCLEWNAGYHVPYENFTSAIGIIKSLKNDEALRKKLGNNARYMASELFSTECAAVTIKKIISDANFGNV